MCDHDSKFGSRFARVAATTNIELLRTPSRAPRAHAPYERFLGSVRRECLDPLLILQERQHQQVLNQYVAYFNRARPQEARPATPSRATSVSSPIVSPQRQDHRHS